MGESFGEDSTIAAAGDDAGIAQLVEAPSDSPSSHDKISGSGSGLIEGDDVNYDNFWEDFDAIDVMNFDFNDVSVPLPLKAVSLSALGQPPVRCGPEQARCCDAQGHSSSSCASNSPQETRESSANRKVSVPQEDVTVHRVLITPPSAYRCSRCQTSFLSARSLT